MTFDKFTEKATITSSIILTLLLCIGQRAMTILTIIFSMFTLVLAGLAMFCDYRNEYKRTKEELKKIRQKQKSDPTLEHHLKHSRAGYIALTCTLIFWNLAIVAIVLLWTDKYYYNIF